MLWDETMNLIWNIYISNLEKEKTIRDYKKIIDDFMTFSQKSFWKTSAEDASAYYYHLSKAIEDGTLKGTTVYKKMKILSHFSEFLVNNNSRIDFPDFYVNHFRSFLYYLKCYDQTYKNNALTINEVDKILKACENDMLAYTIISLVFRTALKPSDITQIRFGDFFADASGTYLTVRRNKKHHVVYLPEDILNILDSYMKKYNISPEPQNYIFYNKYNKPLQERTLQTIINQYAQIAGIKKATLYQVRNSGATLMLSAGIPEESVSRQLGIGLHGIQRYKNTITPPELKDCALTQIAITLPKNNK